MIKTFMNFIKPATSNLVETNSNDVSKQIIELEQSKKEENKPYLQVKEVPLESVVKDLEQPPAPKPKRQLKKQGTSKKKPQQQT
jgi:predicted transcriptional regulator